MENDNYSSDYPSDATVAMYGELNDMADRLRHYSAQLNLLGIVAILFTAFHFFAVMIRFFGEAANFFVPSKSLLLFSATCVFGVLAFAMIRDMYRRRSQALFDEATSLLQLVADKTRRSEQYFFEYRKIREATSLYSMSMDYPLFPGKNGGASLLLVNLMFFLALAGLLFTNRF